MALDLAMSNGFDIECESPVTDSLYHNLHSHFIETISKLTNKYKKIDINTQICPPIQGNTAVCCSFSGGVDSWYSVVKNLNTSISRFRLTHLLFHNAGRTPFWDEKYSVLKNAATSLGLNFIYARSNFYKLFSEYELIEYSAYEYAAYPFALQKLIKIFYSSSDYSITKDALELLRISMLSTEGLSFYLGGMEAYRRIDKIEYICKNFSSIISNSFIVCDHIGFRNKFTNTTSCCHCNKCLRTIMMMHAVGGDKIINTLYSGHNLPNSIKIIWNLLNTIEHENSDYNYEIIEYLKEQGIHIPEVSPNFSSYMDDDEIISIAKELNINLFNIDHLVILLNKLHTLRRRDLMDKILSFEKQLIPAWAAWQESRFSRDSLEAEKLLRKAFALDPAYLPIRKDLIESCRKQGNIDEAVQLCDSGLRHKPHWREGYFIKISMMPEKTVDILLQALSVLPHDTTLIEKAIHMFITANKKDLALKLLQDSIDLMPDYEEGYLTLARLNDAEDAYRKAVNACPSLSMRFYYEMFYIFCKKRISVPQNLAERLTLCKTTYIVSHLVPYSAKFLYQWYRIKEKGQGNLCSSIKIVFQWLLKKYRLKGSKFDVDAA